MEKMLFLEEAQARASIPKHETKSSEETERLKQEIAQERLKMQEDRKQ